MLLNQSKKPMTLSCGCFFRSLRSKSLRFDHENISFHSSVYSTLLFGVIIITVVSCSNSTLLAPFLFFIYTALLARTTTRGSLVVTTCLMCVHDIWNLPPPTSWYGCRVLSLCKQQNRAFDMLQWVDSPRCALLGMWDCVGRLDPSDKRKNKNTTDTHIG